MLLIFLTMSYEINCEVHFKKRKPANMTDNCNKLYVLELKEDKENLIRVQVVVGE